MPQRTSDELEFHMVDVGVWDVQLDEIPHNLKPSPDVHLPTPAANHPNHPHPQTPARNRPHEANDPGPLLSLLSPHGRGSCPSVNVL